MVHRKGGSSRKCLSCVGICITVRQDWICGMVFRCVAKSR